MCAASQPLFAHSANGQGWRQSLIEHLRGVSSLAQMFAEPFGGGDLARLAGLWHDAGKADPAWQRRLLQCEEGLWHGPVGIDHKRAGALLARKAGGAAELAGLLIQGHHGGLRTPTDFNRWLDEGSGLPGPGEALRILREVMPDMDGFQAPDPPAHAASSPIEAELFLRFAYSALVDADSLDTEAHKLGRVPDGRAAAVGLADLWRRYTEFLDRQPPLADTEVNRVRAEVHSACLEAASLPPGIFTLTVPTGGGKTRSSMAFALSHGRQHGYRRVIVAVPFTSITQQTAEVYREIFGEHRVVLEHHSAAADGPRSASGGDDSFDEAAIWQRLASENWNAPIIVTTTVQLFESLFSNQRGKTRKLHNIANSTIIIDEAQSLPPGLLTPILDVLRSLSNHYGVTVVLSTATQPAFDAIEVFREVDAREIVPDHPEHFQRLKRVRYEWRTERPCSWGEVVEWMYSERQTLAIVNTKRHAHELLDELERLKVGDPRPVFHLSTLLCGAHRTAVINEIKGRLSVGGSCLVVSTQVVEAGVDLDFPLVLRAEAPLDAITQAAGRCNREGLLGGAGGRVIVFASPDDGTPSGVYRSGRDITRVVRQAPDFDPEDPQAVRQYSEMLFDIGVDPDSKGVQEARTRLDFPAVAKKFRMIDEDACEVIVDYPDIPQVDRLIELLRSRERSVQETLRSIQPHTVSLRRNEYERLRQMGLVEEVAPLRDVGRWLGHYDVARGLSEADPEMVF